MNLAEKIEAEPKLSHFKDAKGYRWYTERGIVEASSLIGVTSVLEIAVAPKLKDYFVNNSKNKQEKRLKETGDIGTRIHLAIEADLNSKPHEISQDIAPAYAQWLELKEKHKIKPILTEQKVVSQKYGFAGTLDNLIEFEGQPMVGDIKTGFFSVKAGWQLAAYRLAAIEMGLITPGFGMVGLSVPRDGDPATAFKYAHIDWCLKSFVSCFEVWKALEFTRLHKMNWKWLHVNSLEALNGIA